MGFVIIVKGVNPISSDIEIEIKEGDGHKEYIENVINVVTDKFGLLITHTPHIEDAYVFERLAQAKKQVHELEWFYKNRYNAIIKLEIIELENDPRFAEEN